MIPWHSTSAWRGLVLGAALLGGAGCVPLPPMGIVYIQRAPPPIRAEVRGPDPGPGYAWVGGHWDWVGGDFAWVGGNWHAVERGRRSWVPGQWRRDQRGWYWVKGYWR